MSDRARSSGTASTNRPFLAGAREFGLCLVLFFCFQPLVAYSDCQVIGGVDTAGRANGVTFADDYVLVADGTAGLAIVDVGDPTNPMLSGVCPIPDGSGSTMHLAVAGHHAYLVGSQLYIDDWSDPEHPFEVSRLSVGWPYGIAVRDGLAYVADHNDGLKIVDVTDPALPGVIGQVSLPGPGSVHRVAVEGRYAYLVGCANQLFVVDVSVPTQPQLVGSTPYLDGTYEGIAVSGNRVYTSGFGSMRIFDVSSPAAPALLGTAAFSSGRGLALLWPYVYVSTGNETNDAGSLVVLDVTHPEAPTIVRTVEGTGYAWGLHTDGNYLYGAVGYGGVRVFSLETAPAIVEGMIPLTAAGRLVVLPNPTRGPAVIQLDLPQGGPGRLEWFDPTGRLLSTVDLGRLSAGRNLIPVDGRQRPGRQLTVGSCYLRVVHPGGATVGKLILLP